MKTVWCFDDPSRDTPALPAKPAQQHRDSTPAAGSGAAAKAAYLARTYGVAPVGSAAEARAAYLAQRTAQ